MFGKKKSAPELAKSQTGELGDVLSRQAHEWAELLGTRAGSLSEHAKHFAEKAGSEANVYATRASKQAKRYADHGAKWAAPKIETASRRAQDATHHAGEMWEQDYLPRLRAAAEAARIEAAKEGDLKSRAQAISAASSKALTTPPAKKRRGMRFGWLVVAASAAGIGYVVWKRSQPVEDPWAEAYWEDIAAEDAAARAAEPTPPAPVDPVAEAQAVVNDPVQGEKVDTPPLSEAEAAAQAGLADADRRSDLGKPENS
ncbi:hypothetical protein EJO69_08335 [Flaviflexus salsibiostraticola]|uniref:Uncharacterized protein n=1 Tax=Flaviflexus salsibiostraticola TaxID=1282737 RepID=A0A3Q8WUM7_9ACTO|nr:hypothetical protein [Flaviflexus salsibiostraticola]AZN30311.1 hypothetical protein EJO69_08335 [Flaviflexus salsibiostraticola]